MLAATPASKVLPGNQDAGTFDLSLIQFEFSIRCRAVILKPPIIEQELAEPGSFNSFQELLWNDLIGVNIGTVHRCHDACVDGEALHVLSKSCEFVFMYSDCR